MSKIIDCHMHIGSWPTLRKCGNMILRLMDAKGISYGLISNADCTEYPKKIREDWEPVHVSQEEGLEAALRFARRNEDRIGVLAWVNPNKETLSKKLISLISENRDIVYGIKIHPWESRIKLTHEKVEPYIELARDMKLPVLVHTAKDKYSDARYLAYMAKDYPDVRFIAAHMQLNGRYEDVLQIMRNYPNVYADTAWVKMEVAKKVMEAVGPERVLFGTDMPIDGEDSLEHPIYREYFANAAGLDKESYEMLMGKNAKSLFHLHLK